MDLGGSKKVKQDKIVKVFFSFFYA